MFKEYCASCHGVEGKGDGPAVVFLKAPPPDLRTMAQRNKGKYPAAKVVTMLTLGPGSQAHGALDMPTWGRSSALWIVSRAREWRSCAFIT